MSERTTYSVNASSPGTLDEFVGQQEAVDLVKVALNAAVADGSQFPHALMVGPPGLGKSLLARVIAQEMRSRFRETLAHTLACANGLPGLLVSAEDREVLFIDEADGLQPGQMFLLYRSLEEGLLFTSPKSGGGSRVRRAVRLRNFTLLAATNNEFALTAPLRDRFRVLLRFDYYGADELKILLRQRATMLGWEVQEDVLALIAERGRGTPRIALRLLEACRRTCRSENHCVITSTHFCRTCALLSLNEMGLDRTEQRYLQILYESRKVVPLATLAMMMGLPRRTITDVIEAYLVRAELVLVSGTGRQLSAKGHTLMKDASRNRRVVSA